MEEVCSRHEVFLQDLLHATQRPLPGHVRRAAQAAFGGLDDATAQQLAGQVVQVVRQLRRKRENMVSGMRTRSAVQRLCGILRSSLGQQLQANARVLLREASSPRKRRLRQEAEVGRLYGVDLASSTVEVVDLVEDSEPEVAPAVEYWDGGKGAQVRTTADGTVLQATMEKGVDGFLVALWPDGTRTPTEVPNLQLAAATRPPSVARKRPAASSPTTIDLEPISDEDVAAEPGAGAAGSAATLPAQVQLQSGRLRKVLASKQSYITLANPTIFGDAKPHLLVSASAGMAAKAGKNHKAVVEAIFARLQASEDVSQRAAHALREEFLSL